MIALSSASLTRAIAWATWLALAGLAGLALGLACGCQSPGSMTPKPRQSDALSIIWHDIYEQADSPPEVEWHHDVALWGSTVGVTIAGWKVIIADELFDNFSFSATQLAHELLHERTFERTGDVDVGHIRGDWQLVNIANKRLREAGL